MKNWHFLFVLFILLGCSVDNTEMSSSADLNLSPKQQISDTLLSHKISIPYWSWEDYNKGNYWEEPGITKLRFSNFTFKIDGQFGLNAYEIDDTLTVFEDVGWYVEGRSMWIESQESRDQFELAMSVQQHISEQYDYRWYDDPNFDYEKWENQRILKQERSLFYPLEDSAGYYRLDWLHTNGGFFEQRYKLNHNYRDTTNYLDSEGGGNEATLVIDGEPCVYFNEFAIIRITKTTAEGKKRHYYFRIAYSYGC